MRVRVGQQEELDVAGGEEAGDVVVVEAIDVLEVPGDNRLACTESDAKTQALGLSYIFPLPHCTSSTMSRLLCTMNWFMCRASSRNRATPSPPCFDVPNSCSKSGLSFIPMIAK